MECIFLGVIGYFLWYRNNACKLILVYFGVFAGLEKLKKWCRYEVYSNVLPNENWGF